MATTNSKVRSKTGVKIVPRLGVLATTIKEYLKAFGANDACLKTVDSGVYQEQIIEAFYIYYYCKDKLCGQISMNIDWNEYQVCVNSAEGKEFSIADGRSLIEQLDKASKVIVQHVNRIRRDLSVDRIEVRYTYRDCYWSNPEKLEYARKKLGTHAGESINETSTPEFKTRVRFIMEKLKELEIIVET